jgi:hypothetical protein
MKLQMKLLFFYDRREKNVGMGSVKCRKSQNLRFQRAWNAIGARTRGFNDN